MGELRRVGGVKLICGMLSGDADLLARAAQLLARSFGAVDLTSDTWPFDQTDYYEAEMGPNLLRRFVSFERLASPDQLASIKRETNALEERIADECVALGVRRPVNLDPGYVHSGKLVLASTKDASHRIYLGHRVYAEVTLQYRHGQWRPQEWTYADYRQGHYFPFFSEVRERLLRALRSDEGETV
ncbi:MAG: DUF4416 family protein [Planctomycetota bacterium]|nr:MAG: DUF4416 family protein [Planctomycetota bacterium]